MGWSLGDFLSNPIGTTWDSLTSIPGSPEAGLSAMWQGANGDLSWNPYSPDNSVWDYGAGGSVLSQDPEKRQIGRTIGGAAATWGTAGALSPYLGTTGGYAAAGGLSGAAQTAGTGGNASDIAKAGVKGAAIGAGSAQMPNYASYAGVSNPVGQGVINGGINGVAGSAINGGDTKQNLQNGLGGGIVGGLNGFSSQPNLDYGQSPAPWSGGTFGAGGDYGVQASPAPWAASNTPTFMSGPGNTATGESAGMQSEHPMVTGIKSIMGMGSNLFDTPGQVGNLRYGDLAQGLMGLYGGYQQRKQARDMMSMMGMRRNAYGEQLQKDLIAKDRQTGARSNYAGRAVQLQSGLAKLDSQNAPAMMQLQNNSLYGLANMMQSGGMMLNRGGAFDRGLPAPMQSFNPNNIQPQPVYTMQNTLDATPPWARRNPLIPGQG